MRICDSCKIAEAVFHCKGDGPMMPKHLVHEPHDSCSECDLGNGCRMVAGEKLKGNVCIKCGWSMDEELADGWASASRSLHPTEGGMRCSHCA